MKQRGKRIRPSGKDLVFNFTIASLLPVFLLVVGLFHVKTIQQINWQDFNLSQADKIDIPYLIISFSVAILICLLVAFVFKRVRYDTAGIGLFRSEFLYLEADNYPDEEAQFQAYKTVAENMAGKKVIVRTLDIGADKQVDYFNLDHEENPAMGYRAIRICLDRRDIFRTQLRALLRASAYGNIGIMYPMIISVDEVKEIKKIVESIKAELTEKGIEYGEVEQGIMIETPAAVMISDLLAEEVDFFSIGTNDLTQYTLAIDRQNSKLDNIYDSHHPAVLRMIQKTIENGHKAGCWVGICGELGADMTLTETFLKMGIDELSVSPTFVLPIRKLIREMSTK